ncbi:diaminopimelate decarboxylase [Piscinibacter koreensis]|uniref:Diaminopimelate decarboxylase n=1 Tax=Piscinibacter koreensis TaxID=2742824 RepID=A0A7Y6NLZ1_9BURK|nr:diaminopimelate decarboxylase [Schlegelella koreensis]NUZ05633.1 diaminopimelate decarboxylase [Schlegelella koreensis]
MKLPGHPHVRYRGADLVVDDCVVADLARRFGTPLYVYSRRAMLASLADYRRALAGRNHLLCYAMKANSNLAVLQVFAEAGCGFDIVSGGELERVLAVGVDPARIVFSGVGKTRSEMRRALDAGVLSFNVESDPELDVLSEVAAAAGKVARISLRINPDVDPQTHPYISTGLKANKFGIAHAHAVDTYRRAAALPGLRVVGIDCHIGSQITAVDPYLDAVDRLLDLVEAIESHGIAIEHVDIGGGLGITYANEEPPSAELLMKSVLGRLDARGHGQRKLVLEPGRSLVGNAGVLASEVLYLKPGDEKNFCIVDAAMNDMIRPTLYGAWMGIVECTRDAARPAFRADVVGPVCESGDWLGRDRELAVQPGDFVAVLSAGAYGMAAASNYNTRGRPAEVMVDGSDVWLIRERESTADQMRGEHLLPVR